MFSIGFVSDRPILVTTANIYAYLPSAIHFFEVLYGIDTFNLLSSFTKPRTDREGLEGQIVKSVDREARV